MPFSLYAQDVVHMAKAFMEEVGFLAARDQPRSLDALSGPQPSQPLEVRNAETVDSCFFMMAFEGKTDTHHNAGVRYSLEADKYLKMVDFKVTSKLEMGFSQFFEFEQKPGYDAMSYWVSDAGFWYVLSYKPADVAQRRYETPSWIIQAGSSANCV